MHKAIKTAVDQVKRGVVVGPWTAGQQTEPNPLPHPGQEGEPGGSTLSTEKIRKTAQVESKREKHPSDSPKREEVYINKIYRRRVT